MNEALFDTIRNFAASHPTVLGFVPFVADTLPVLIIVGLVIFVLVHTHEEHGMGSVFVLFSSAFVGFGLEQAIKSFDGVARPFVALHLTPLITDTPLYDSFPSGHVAFLTTMATVMWFYHRGISIILFLLTILVGLARIAAGVHWPSDVLGGALVGVISGLIVYHAYYAFIEVYRSKHHL